MVNHVIRSWNKKYVGDSLERWHIAGVLMHKMENRTKSQIIFSLGVLIYLNKSCNMGSQLGSHLTTPCPQLPGILDGIF